MTKTFLTTSALALILGLGAAIAQSGGDVRSNDRKIEKTLDNKELTPIRPIRKVGESSWPEAKMPSPTQTMSPANSAQNSAPATSTQSNDKPANPPAGSAQNNPGPDPQQQPARAEGGGAATTGQAAAKDDANNRPDNRAGNNATQPAAPKQATQNPAPAPQPNDRAQQAGHENDAAQQNARQDRDQNRDKNNSADLANGGQDKNNFASIRLGTDANGRVAVNERQEHDIVTALRHQRVRPIEANIRVTVGMAAPRDIRLGSVSADLVAVLPQFRGYSFFATREEIAIVEPSSQKVVAIVPLGSRAMASSPSRDQSTQRTIGETTTRTETPADTTARTEVRPLERDVTVGLAVQDEDVMVGAPPRTTTIYRMVPAYPSYRTYSYRPRVRVYPPHRYSPGDAQQ
jgi:hypothetical protein